MKKIALIAAVDREWGIGCRNELLFHLRQDLAAFRERTLHNIVVMGRKTFESLPGKRPLPDRKNIVLSRGKVGCGLDSRSEDGFLVLHSVEEVLGLVEGEREDVFIIGGGEIYRQFLGTASEAYITKVDAVREADTYFPDLDQMPDWNLISDSGGWRDEGDVRFQFLRYSKRQYKSGEAVSQAENAPSDIRAGILPYGGEMSGAFL